MSYNITTLIPVFTFILGLVGKIVYDLWRDSTQRRNEALKIHFRELEEQYIKPASEFLNCISNHDGILEYYDTDGQYTIDATKTSLWPTYNLSDNFTCFRVHFAHTANKLLSLEKEVKLNNEKNGALNAEITSLLEEKSGIQVRDYTKESNLTVPFFSPLIVTFMRLSYWEILDIHTGYKRVDDQRFNFREVKYSSSQQDNSILGVTLKDGRELAKVNNADEAEKCRKALVEIAEDTELTRKGQVLYRQAEVLVDSSRNLSKRLGTICEIYGKFGSVLRKNKECSICNLIQ
jgi:hypothetical protein